MNTMERSERYDPEDLEHLMLERSFDELLAEERAYALRHLADRAEYERMRALLHHVREGKRDNAPMDADPAVREHVLAAFRAQQQPQWRIWLNSVGGFLLPSRPSMYWRPALALGTVAVLIFASLMTWNAMEPKGNKVLAEVKQGTPAQPAPAKPALQEQQAEPATLEEHNEQAVSRNAITSTFSTNKQLEDVDAVASTGAAAKDDRTGVSEKAKSEALVTTAVAEPATTVYAQRGAEEHATVGSADRKRQFKEATVQASSPVAMADVAAKTEQAYTEDDLLGLLRAAW